MPATHIVTDPVSCLKPGCCRTWPRDPVLEVACPTCSAGVGVRCRRPSEHRVFGGEPHGARDVLADKLGHYGPCPLGLCGATNVRQAHQKPMPAGGLFDETARAQADLFDARS